ncbi:MAG TPA: NAD(P)/FAD-dependent oxidoreductase [Vicinamibacteria bacterium]|nr:NAD(P)/FAD-dependent oxidoreductase [Vicinamibacteria bacterium]
MGRRIDADVLIAGGGPAGASSALRLAQYGHEVLLLDKGPKGDVKRQHVGESLPSSIRVVLTTLGLELPPELVATRPPSHLVYWGEMQGGRSWADVSERESSLLVWRGRFDRFLREKAAAAGVRLVPDAVSRVSRSEGAVDVRTVGGAELRARFFIDATGRSGVLARSYRRKQSRFRTLALTGHFRTEETSPPTIVEAFEDGWIWTAPLANGLRDVTVMLEASEARSDRSILFASALGGARNVSSLVSGASLSGPLRGIDATPYDASRFCGADFLLVGDAASFLDPLSAHGVHKAMDGALVAAVSAHTILERPERASDAADFYNRREGNIYRITTERLRALYRQETRFSARPFWRKRSEGPVADAARPAPRAPLDKNQALRGSGVVAEAAVVEGDFIERREVLVAPGQERPVRFLGPVCLPELYKEVVSTGSALEAARRSPVGLERALAAVDWLYREGYLEPRDSTEL